MSQESGGSAAAALEALAMEGAPRMLTDEELVLAAADLDAEMEADKNKNKDKQASGSGSGSGVPAGNPVGDDAAVVDKMDCDADADDAAADAAADDAAGAAAAFNDKAGSGSGSGSGVPAGSGDGGDDAVAAAGVAADDAVAATAVAAAVAADGEATGDASGEANGEATGALMIPPVPSRQLTLYEMSEEEEEEEEEEEVSDYEDMKLSEKAQQDLEKMLVDIKSEVALAETKLNNTGKKLLKELLRDESITKEQQTKINSLFMKTNDLSDKEMNFFKMVVDAEITAKEVPAEVRRLQEKERRIEDAIDQKLEAAMLSRKQKLDSRIAAKVARAKSPAAKRRK